MGCMVHGSNPSAGRDFPHPSRLALGPHSLIHKGYWVSFIGVHWLWCDIDHPHPSSAEVKERVESGFSGLGVTLYCTVREAIKNWTEEQHTGARIDLPGLRHSKLFTGKPYKVRADTLLKLSRCQLRT
jgi:hypothetical protein